MGIKTFAFAGLCAAGLLLGAGCKSSQGSTSMGGGGYDGPVTRSTFNASNVFTVNVPEGAKKVRAWFATPRKDDPSQKISNWKAEASSGKLSLHTAADGNTYLHLIADGTTEKTVTVKTSFTDTRTEIRNDLDPAKTRPLTAEELKKHAEYLQPNTHVVIDDNMRNVAKTVVGEEKNPITAARLMYDWVLNHVHYWVKDPAKNNTLKASPVGSSTHCYTTKTGNCTDFHSLYLALSRAAGFPVRLVYGSFFKKSLDGQDSDQSYHCWPEFYVPNYGWVSHDVAIADMYVGDFQVTEDNKTRVTLTTADGTNGENKAMVDYYFGNLDSRRVTWSIGRDLTLAPKQDGGPVNALFTAYVEIDGVMVPQKTGDAFNWTRKLTFTEQK